MGEVSLIAIIIYYTKIDRIDALKDGSLLVIDYKSGGEDPMSKSAGRIKTMEMRRKNICDTVKSFQLPLYLYLARESGLGGSKGGKLNAALYYLRNSEIKSFLKPEESASSEEIVDVFMQALKFILCEINNPDENFISDEEDARYCGNCPFFYLCR